MSARARIINKLADGRYQARVWDDCREGGAGYTSKRFASKSAAVAWAQQVEGRIARGQRTENLKRRTTVLDEAQRWYALEVGKSPAPAGNTRRRIEREVRLYIEGRPIGARPVEDLRVSEVTAWLNALCSHMAPQSANLVLSTLRRVLDMSALDSKATHNAARLAKPAKRAHVSAEDAVIIAMPLGVIDALRASLKADYRIGVTLSLGLGLRAGELCGLTIDRVNFLKGTVRIDRQLDSSVSVHHPAPFMAPKHDSIRTVPATPALLDAIRAHVEAHGLGAHGLIFHSTGGTPMTPRSWDKMFARGLARIELARGDYTTHALRHAFGSYQLAQGHQPVKVAKWMGHRNLATFLGVYAHDVEGDDATSDIEAIERPSVHTTANRAQGRAQGRAQRALKVV